MPLFLCSKCNIVMSGVNSAHSLSLEEGWKDKPGCAYKCKCKYPVRAEEIRKNVFETCIGYNKDSIVNAYIYCEDQKNQAHVYYGTYSKCVRGNGYTAKQMARRSRKGLKTFERYYYAR